MSRSSRGQSHQADALAESRNLSSSVRIRIGKFSRNNVSRYCPELFLEETMSGGRFSDSLFL